MKKRQQGFAMIEMFSMFFFLMQFKVTLYMLGPTMIALALLAMFFNAASRSSAILRK